jgi:hypothetical protein
MAKAASRINRVVSTTCTHVLFDGDDLVTAITAQDDKEYFRKRAFQELERAQAGGHPAAVASHYGMATYYLDRASADTVRLR